VKCREAFDPVEDVRIRPNRLRRWMCPCCGEADSDADDANNDGAALAADASIAGVSAGSLPPCRITGLSLFWSAIDDAATAKSPMIRNYRARQLLLRERSAPMTDIRNATFYVLEQDDPSAPSDAIPVSFEDAFKEAEKLTASGRAVHVLYTEDATQIQLTRFAAAGIRTSLAPQG